jgi:hypothetical protein
VNPVNIPQTQLKVVEADRIKIFYREAGLVELVSNHEYWNGAAIFTRGLWTEIFSKKKTQLTMNLFRKENRS